MTTALRIRLAAVAASPVFYQVPLYRALAAHPAIDLTVLYCSSGGVRPYDAGFNGRAVTWDVDLLSGYRSEFAAAADDNDVLDGFFALTDRDLYPRIRRGGFDAVWVHGFAHASIWLALAAAATARVPVLMREEMTLLPHARPWPKRWIRAAVLSGLFQGVRGLYIGSNNREYFVRYGVPPERLFFVPYCTDNAALQAEAARLAPEREALRRSFGIADDAGPVVLCVGKLLSRKQPDVVLEAFRRARRDRRLALLYVGEGPLEAGLRERVRRLRIPDVYFTGFLNRSEISRAYAAADIFVLFSRRETWGIVVNEAMNFGLPLVLSDQVGSARDLVEDGSNGYVIPYDDPAGLARSFERLAGDTTERARLGQRSREIVSCWSYDTAARGIVAACETATRGSRRRA